MDLGVKQRPNFRKVLGCSLVRPLSNLTPPICWQKMRRGAGDWMEFELNAPRRRTRWPTRRRRSGREQAGGKGPNGVGLATMSCLV